jgi:hypothetical protein
MSPAPDSMPPLLRQLLEEQRLSWERGGSPRRVEDYAEH